MKRIFIFLIIIFFIFSFNDVSAKNIIVVNNETGRVLYKNNVNEKKLIASITKIMTCIIVLENGDLNDEVIVGDEILPMYGTNVYLEIGERIKIIDLLYGLMLRSGNDCSVVLAKYISGNEEEFVKLMNIKAKELGMSNTFFSNCHGLDDDSKNYSSAYDMSILAKYAFDNKIYRNIIYTKKYRCSSNLKSYLWYNRVSILNDYKFSLGGKNGYTPAAGKTLVSYAKKNNFTLTIVSLDDGNIYTTHKNLFDKYFEMYNLYKIVDKNKFYINDEFISDDDIYLKDDFYYLLKKDEIDDIKTIVRLDKKCINGIIGKIDIIFDNEVVGSLRVYCNKKKKHISFFQKFKNLFV